MCSLFALLTVFDRFPRLLPIDLLLYNPRTVELSPRLQLSSYTLE